MTFKAVVYCSNTGHTKRYAEAFAKETGLPLVEASKAKKELREGDRVVYFGWLMAGKIQGFENAWKRFDVPVACSVGLYPDSERFREYVGRNNILIDVDYFHLRGGITPEKLKGPAKILMNIMMRTIRAKIEKKQDVTDEERAMLAAYEEAADFVDLSALEPVLARYRAICAADEEAQEEKR